jgi:uncharacterized protein (DUF983 family)
MVMFFGLYFLLIRGAFAMQKDQCQDCGATQRYKSTGSWVAVVVLVVLIFCVYMALTMEE